MSGQGFKRRSASDTLKRLTLHSKPNLNLFWCPVTGLFLVLTSFKSKVHGGTVILCQHIQTSKPVFRIWRKKLWICSLQDLWSRTGNHSRYAPTFFPPLHALFVTSTSGGVLHSEDISANQFLIDYRQVGDTKHDIIYMEVTHKSQWQKVYSDCIMAHNFNWHKIQAGYCHVRDTVYWIPKS